MHEALWTSRRPLRVSMLGSGNHAAPLASAREHVQWGEEPWSNVMFFDQARFGFRPEECDKHVVIFNERVRYSQNVYGYRGGAIYYGMEWNIGSTLS